MVLLSACALQNPTQRCAGSVGGDTPWSEVRLETDNRAFEPIVVRGERLHDLSIVAELVEMLRAPGGGEAP